jgi:hypothetical protein
VAHGLPRPGDGTDPATSARGLPGAAIDAIGSFAPSKLPQFADKASGLGLVDDGLLPVGRQRGLNGVTDPADSATETTGSATLSPPEPTAGSFA